MNTIVRYIPAYPHMIDDTYTHAHMYIDTFIHIYTCMHVYTGT